MQQWVLLFFFKQLDKHRLPGFADFVCHEEEIAITDPSPAVTTVLAIAICGVQIASAKEWGFFKGG